jgi:hypothetical protein
LSRRLKRVGRREAARRHRDLSPGAAAVIAGAVDALVVHSGDNRQVLERWDAADDAF